MKNKNYILLIVFVIIATLAIGLSAQNEVIQPDIQHVAAKTAPDYDKDISLSESITNFGETMGFANLDWKTITMLIISCILLYLAIVKKFEPLLLLLPNVLSNP